MNFESGNKKAFTIIELVVAMGLMGVVFIFASVIFKVCVNSQNVAIANAEILQKLRVITSQLDADFKGLNKDGEIFIIWNANRIADTSSYEGDLDDCYERFDRIMFFADGDFQSYHDYPPVRGNTAMICYMMGKTSIEDTSELSANERFLTRTQHILTADQDLTDVFDTNDFTSSEDWRQWRNEVEYDQISLKQWGVLPFRAKINMLSIIGDANFLDEDDNTINNIMNSSYRGAIIDFEKADSFHMLLCEGVGEFMIQGWLETEQRWLPQVDPDDNGNMSDSNFDFETNPLILYPYPPFGQVHINNKPYPSQDINKANFNSIPGLGKALKFTFTLYDSRGIIKEGRTFTHIVYLDS